MSTSGMTDYLAYEQHDVTNSCLISPDIVFPILTKTKSIPAMYPEMSPEVYPPCFQKCTRHVSGSESAMFPLRYPGIRSFVRRVWSQTQAFGQLRQQSVLLEHIMCIHTKHHTMYHNEAFDGERRNTERSVMSTMSQWLHRWRLVCAWWRRRTTGTSAFTRRQVSGHAWPWNTEDDRPLRNYWRYSNENLKPSDAIIYSYVS